MLAGLEKPTKGEIIIAGEHMETKNETSFLSNSDGSISALSFSHLIWDGTMNAVENVAPLTFQGVSRRERIKRAKKMVHLVDLINTGISRPNQMSGGQQQRVGVARALVVNPEIIFADEPTGNLDSNTSREIMNLMQNVVRNQHQTLIMVTHDITLASFADKIIRIVDGKIVDMIDNTKINLGEKEEEIRNEEV